MLFEKESNYYDILEISPDASSQQIREAYLRIKTTYHRDHVALYTVFTQEEREQILKAAETAYLVLSDTEKRREYDLNFGSVLSEENPFQPGSPTPPPRPKRNP